MVASHLRLHATVWSFDHERCYTPGTSRFDPAPCALRSLAHRPNTGCPMERSDPQYRGASRRAVRRSFAMPIAHIAHCPCGATATIAVRSCNRYQSPLVLPLLPWRGSDTAQLHRFLYTHNGFYEFNDTLKRTFVKPRI